MQIGMFFCAAIFQPASTPVPSVTIATALRSTARRMLATARLGEPPLSDVTTLKLTMSPRSTPRFAAASLTPSAIVVPM